MNPYYKAFLQHKKSDKILGNWEFINWMSVKHEEFKKNVIKVHRWHRYTNHERVMFKQFLRRK